MFNYSDPTLTNALEQVGAIGHFRERIHEAYLLAARIDQAAFTLIEAFGELDPVDVSTVDVPWPAFPRTAPASASEIDNDRFQFQDEYIEWHTERDASGNVTRITFTTEFPEYFEAFAMVSAEALKAEIARLIPGAAPQDSELFGPGINVNNLSPRTRAQRFRNFLQQNPWNNGQRGILCLTQPFNTLGALVNLQGHCSVPRKDIDAAQVCAAVGGFCGPLRNSDPRVSLGVQNLARQGQALTAADPAGIFIQRLEGAWELGDQRVGDINQAADIWTVSRGGHRGVLHVTPNLTLGGDPITSGAQVSARLIVAASVLHTPDNKLPDWARAGNESRLEGRLVA